MSQNMCPICGKPLDDSNADILDNGSPAHPQCAENERKYQEENKRKRQEEMERKNESYFQANR